MQMKDLKPNKRNPRKISPKRLEMLKASLIKFGDLSGIVFNRNTRNIVSGHQRQKTLPPDAKIVIEKKYDAPTGSFTVAEGYVEFGEERIKYREVDATPEWEMEALLAANNHGGEWDKDLLKIVIADFPALDLNIAGFDMPRLAALDITLPKFDNKPIAEPTDEEYVAATEQTTEQIPVENAFATVNETTEPAGRRIVLIIDCKSDEMKADLKERLRPIVDEAGAKFF